MSEFQITTVAPASGAGFEVLLQQRSEPNTPAEIEANLIVLREGLAWAAGDLNRLHQVGDEANRQKVKYLTDGLMAAATEASLVMADVELRVAAAPKMDAGRPPAALNSPTNGTISDRSEIRYRHNVRNALTPLVDRPEVVEELKQQARETNTPYSRKAWSEAARAKAREAAKEERKAELAAATPAAVSDRWSVDCLDIDDFGYQLPAHSVDIIFTDPPYGREWLDVYDDLSTFAAGVLRPEGILICLTGHAHLPSIIERLSDNPELRYLWTGAYVFGGKTLTQPASHQVLLQVGWKPILLYGRQAYRGSWFANAPDLVMAPPPELGDDRKLRHKWGQQLPGMAAILKQFTRDFQPGALVVDPFCGSGTNGIAALDLGFRFKGADVDADVCAVARGYISEVIGDGS